MKIKKCSECKNEYLATLDYFYKDVNGTLGLHAYCKACSRDRVKRYALKNPDKVKSATKKWRSENPEKVKAGTKKWISENPDKVKEYNSRKYQKDKKKYINKTIKWQQENREKYNKKQREWYANNKEKSLQSRREYIKNNPEKRKATKKKSAAKINSKPKGNLSNRMRAAIQQSIGSEKGGRSWETLVGYTASQLKRHIERRFVGGMAWNNYGEWHIDHIIPISAFNFTKPEHEDFRRCWALFNLQPMWAKENITKGARLEKPFQPSLAL